MSHLRLSETIRMDGGYGTSNRWVIMPWQWRDPFKIWHRVSQLQHMRSGHRVNYTTWCGHVLDVADLNPTTQATRNATCLTCIIAQPLGSVIPEGA